MDMNDSPADGVVYRSTVVALSEDNQEPKQSFSTVFKNKASRWCTRKTLHRRLPCLTWLRGYSSTFLVGDLIAGFTVGLMLIPQALAYGIVAGLPPNYGLYSAWMGCFVYCLLGSSMELTIGPTAIMALMTLQYTSCAGPQAAVPLAFTAGLIELLAGMLNLGFLINFISQPVISGFTSAAAITIASSQLKPLLGLKFDTNGNLDTWAKVLSNLHNLHWQDLILGLTCVAVLTFMKFLMNIGWPCIDRRSKSPVQQILRQTIFYLSVGRNAFVVIVTSLIAYAAEGEQQPFTLTGDVEAGVPPVVIPFLPVTNGNETLTYSEIMSNVGVGVVMIPFIAVLDNIAIVSAFSKGRTFDATQEIIALGVTNILGSFFGSMPTTGSLSRTAVNLTSGVKTPLGGLVTGVMVLLSLAFLTPSFRYIPKASLAAIIICAVMHMLDYEIILPLWHSKKMDLLPLIITFLSCLFWGLEWGILLGITINLSMLLYFIATPKVKITSVIPTKQHNGYVLVTPSHGVHYPSTVHVRNAIRKAGLKEGAGSLPLVVDCTFLETADYTSAKGLKCMVEEFLKRGQPLIFVGMKPSVHRTVGALERDIRVCPSFETLHLALRECQENGSSINGDHLHGSVFVDASKVTTPTSDTSDAANPLLTPSP